MCTGTSSSAHPTMNATGGIDQVRTAKVSHRVYSAIVTPVTRPVSKIGTRPRRTCRIGTVDEPGCNDARDDGGDVRECRGGGGSAHASTAS